jgi:hypothetical protein
VAYPAANEMKSPADSPNLRPQSHACCGTYYLPRPESRLRLYNNAIAHRHTPGPGRLYTKYGVLFGIANVVRPLPARRVARFNTEPRKRRSNVDWRPRANFGPHNHSTR